MEKQEEEDRAKLPPGVHPHIVPACEINPDKTPEAWQMFEKAREKKETIIEKLKTEDGLDDLTAEIQYLKIADGCHRDRFGNILTVETNVEPLKENCWPCPEMPVEVSYDLPFDATPEQIKAVEPSKEVMERWAAWQETLQKEAAKYAEKHAKLSEEEKASARYKKPVKYKTKPPKLTEIKEDN